MRLGRVHLTGPQAWPDHLLNEPSVGAIVAVGRYALGFEVGRHTPWLSIYLGAWAFEVYVDVAGDWDG